MDLCSHEVELWCFALDDLFGSQRRGPATPLGPHFGPAVSLAQYGFAWKPATPSGVVGERDRGVTAESPNQCRRSRAGEAERSNNGSDGADTSARRISGWRGVPKVSFLLVAVPTLPAICGYSRRAASEFPGERRPCRVTPIALPTVGCLVRTEPSRQRDRHQNHSGQCDTEQMFGWTTRRFAERDQQTLRGLGPLEHIGADEAYAT